MPATQLWRKMLSMLFETGHPWITFKDPCNLRSPQQHVGVVHSSNLCTEITLNTGPDEIAVCNLGSVNMPAHLDLSTGRMDMAKLKRTIGTAMRMLDNVIDINYYSVAKARNSNFKHRPVGLGIMGFQDCLHLLRVPYGSPAAVEFADRSMEEHRLHRVLGIDRSRRRARPVLDVQRLAVGPRHPAVRHDQAARRRARRLRRMRHVRHARLGRFAAPRIKQVGMRNSNCIAIAPTATIANITGLSQCIEPTYQNLYVKSNLSGEFTVVNEFLVRDLKKLNLWDEVMIADLKYFDGSLSKIDRIPPDVRTPLRDGVRDRAAMAGRMRGAPPEMGRPVAVAQHLHGGRLRQEARRDLQARVAARTQDDVLPAHAGRDVDRKVDRARRAAECRVGRRCARARDRGRCSQPSSARSTTPNANRASKHRPKVNTFGPIN